MLVITVDLRSASLNQSQMDSAEIMDIYPPLIIPTNQFELK